LAELDATTGEATAWNPDADHEVLAIHVHEDAVYAGGAFDSMGLTPQKRIAFFDVDGGPPPDPDTTITSGPSEGSTITTSTATFEFSSDTAGATFECAVDGGAFVGCTTPFTTPTLGNGSHTFRVRAVFGGQTDPTPATRNFNVNVTSSGPDTEILSGPNEGSTVTTSQVEFEFVSHGVGATFECSMDGAAFAPCTSPHTIAPLANGAHTFRVRAIAGGQTDPTPATRNFNVNVGTPTPDTTITAGPDEGSTVQTQSVTFSFTSPATGATFECSIDGADFTPCGSPLTRLFANGAHTFRVRAVAGAAVDPSPAARSFTVNVPSSTYDTIITSGPNEGSTIATFVPEFSFRWAVRATTSRPARIDADFECSMDGAPFTKCNSPHRSAPVSNGQHTFRVRAIVNGNTDPTPDFRNFTVDSHPHIFVDIASSCCKKVGKSVRIGAVANMKLKQTPFVLQILTFEGAVLETCKKKKCFVEDVSAVPATRVYLARVIDQNTQVIQAQSRTITVEWVER
jgi:hypothetical protein